MAQYIINATHSSVFGMDVHARSVTVCGVDRVTGEEKTKRFSNCPTPEMIAEWMKKHFTSPYHAGYESGCTGFYLARELCRLGIDCEVIAVSSIARSTEDKQRKTDIRDAKRLRDEMLKLCPSYTVVWIPDEKCEAARDLARTRADAVAACKRAKQQLSALLLRHGHVWNAKTAKGNLKKTWGREHWAWIEKIDLGEEVANKALALYKNCVRRCIEEVEEISKLVIAEASAGHLKPYIDALVAFKGVDVQTAYLAWAQFGDFTRFKNGRAVSKWLGVTPRESSSGEHTAHGRITKAGDAHLRCALVEGTASIHRRATAPKRLAPGHLLSPEVASICDKANRRLKQRYEHLVCENRLNANKAKVAIVSELVRWMWIVGLEVQRQISANA